MKGMNHRRCERCGNKIHAKLRPDAKYCGRSCKSSFHRERNESGHSAAEPKPVPLTSALSNLAEIILSAAPPGAQGYALRKHGSPLGNGLFLFPVPFRKTKHADGRLQRAGIYCLSPFEPPRIPWPGMYELLFLVPNAGFVASQNPERQQLYLGQTVVMKRAAFDEAALWLAEPSPDGSDAGSPDYLRREILARSHPRAVGYTVSIQSSTPEEGVMLFPPYGALSRRISGGLSDAPSYRLNPFELPYVPWVGTYQLSYRLNDGLAYLPPESERQIRIGTVFPRSLPKIVKQEPNKGVLPSNGNASPLLLLGTVRPSRVLRLSRAKRR